MELNEEKMFRRHKKLIDGIMGNNRLIVFPGINRTGLKKKKKKKWRRKGKRAEEFRLESGGIKNITHAAVSSISKQFDLS